MDMTSYLVTPANTRMDPRVSLLTTSTVYTVVARNP